MFHSKKNVALGVILVYNGRNRQVVTPAGILTTNNRQVLSMAKYIVDNGIRIDKDHENFVPETFGRLTTIGPKFLLRDGFTKEGYVSRHAHQVCQCSCSAKTIIVVSRSALLSGHTLSCGCLHAEHTSACNTIHGKCGTPEYRIWVCMRERCRNPNHVSSKNYTQRGITVCSRWEEPNGQGFVNFLADMGPKPPECRSVDRIDVNGNYCPENCRWATDKEQGRNRRNNNLLTYKGKTQCLTAWAEELGIKPSTLRERLQRNYDVARAFETPVRKQKS